MYQLDSWYTVLFELLLVGFSLYNSLRMTTWWNVVAKGTEIGVNGAQRVPSVADHFGIRTDEKKNIKSSGKRSMKSPTVFEMGDGLEVH
ncbi:hypothetical protein GCK72_009361 [Caenorhabditis remanei]|uniref:Uncharacterized protein n=1 Tax=Caenorhabditis remanei TaxID=31234 RepID=A0A6A5H1I6_CAERE|nr:hypothetical protein GCK72_009361 [Caenorhabditis remanei]KAF1761107.1 hypothetical protein GCK72_009361 [Caenorhabditis remanei]